MADNLSNYLENKLLDHTVGKTSFTMPGTVAAALFTSTATAAELEAGTLTNEVSTSGTAYARVTVAGASWNSASGGSITTNAAITFAAATGSGFGTVRFVALMDSATAGAGNVLWHGQLSADKTIAATDVFQISAGQITLTLA